MIASATAAPPYSFFAEAIMTLPTVSKPRHDPVTTISPIAEIIAEARNGKPFILVDADDRENEGDIIIPAQFATPDRINQMAPPARSEEHTSELQSLMRISYAVFCLKKKRNKCQGKTTRPYD